jgi:hypothetical protein
MIRQILIGRNWLRWSWRPGSNPRVHRGGRSRNSGGRRLRSTAIMISHRWTEPPHCASRGGATSSGILVQEGNPITNRIFPRTTCRIRQRPVELPSAHKSLIAGVAGEQNCHSSANSGVHACRPPGIRSTPGADPGNRNRTASSARRRPARTDRDSLRTHRGLATDIPTDRSAARPGCSSTTSL